MDHEFKWLELKVKLQEDAARYRNKQLDSTTITMRAYNQGGYDSLADILKWVVDELPSKVVAPLPNPNVESHGG